MLLKVCEDIGKLARDCEYRADLLAWAGSRRRRLRRTCNFTSGLVALLSSGASAAIATNLITNTITKFISAAAVLTAGLISLITNQFLDDSETEKLLEGAAKLRGVQWDAELALVMPEFVELTEEARKRKFGKQSTSIQPLATEQQDERDSQFRSGAQLAYGKLTELKRRRSEAAEYEYYFTELRDAHLP